VLIVTYFHQLIKSMSGVLQWTHAVRRLLASHSTSGPGVSLELFKRKSK
jgi:hypothetical protein